MDRDEMLRGKARKQNKKIRLREITRLGIGMQREYDRNEKKTPINNSS